MNVIMPIISHLLQDCDTGVFESIAYTCRQINSCCTPLQFFNLVIKCSLDQVEAVKVALLKCYDHVEVEYCYNKSTESVS